MLSIATYTLKLPAPFGARVHSILVSVTLVIGHSEFPINTWHASKKIYCVEIILILINPPFVYYDKKRSSPHRRWSFPQRRWS